MRYKSDFRFGARRTTRTFHQSKTRAVTILFLLSLLFAPLSSFADKYGELLHSPSTRNGVLQRVFQQFPLLTPSTNSDGRCSFQTLDLKEPTVSIEGVGFYGFRFKVPKRTHHGDFVWAFGAPHIHYNWFIISQMETMPGFEEYFNEPRKAYEGLEHLFPTSGNEVVLQSLPGDDLEDDEEYLIWFSFRTPKPAHMSIAFTFAESQSQKSRRGAIEKALGLKRKPKKPVHTETAP
jgi:hypothetical protein